jgi:hypothetical protein
VTVRVAHGGLEPEFTNVDVRQSDVPALGAELLAPLQAAASLSSSADISFSCCGFGPR